MEQHLRDQGRMMEETQIRRIEAEHHIKREIRLRIWKKIGLPDGGRL